MNVVEWERYGTVGEHVVWRGGDVFNITDGEAPLSDGGYYNLESLLKLKGFRIEDVVTAIPPANPPTLRF
ncbi:hypothetical protein GOB57_22320 [Sinorhizobium meliloti]|nr:hypothetical protein [Sinorhizobium meliloti]